MALYFNSATFGTMCFPRIDYNWLYGNGFGGVEGCYRSDVPFSFYISPYDLLGSAENGAYVEILHGMTDGTQRVVDVGIIKTNDNLFSIYSVSTGETPTSGSVTEMPMVSSQTGKKVALYMGYSCYDNDLQNNPQFEFFIDAPMQAYNFSFNYALDRWSGSNIGSSDFIQCTYTNDQLGIGLFDIPSVDNFTATRQYNPYYRGNFLNSNIATANGGAGSGTGANYEGEYSQPDFGNGNYILWQDSRGHAESYTDTLLSIGLIDIYNPNFSDLSALASYLHSDNFIDVINKMWDNPMESIISLAMFPIAPAETEPKNIILGGVDTGISSVHLYNSHTRQVFMGQIDFQSELGEYYGSFLDYNPHTSVKLYLPYIGFITIDVNDIMNTRVSLWYTIDFLNGDLLAQLDVNDGATRTIESLHGNCAIQIPLTSSNYAAVYQSIFNAGASIASGNVIGAINEVSGEKVTHNNNSSIGGSAGAMGDFHPYALITRPVKLYPRNYYEINGAPLETGGTVNLYHGLTIGKIECQIATATDREKEEIESIFANGGVYLV